ncbi:amino acid adenylation domain-containing protein [Micromonosporaceae bacterium Da 78-11]
MSTTVTDLAVARLRATGGGVAVRSGPTDLTARELDDWSAGIASWLRENGVGRGSFVPVLAARGGALVAACLGVLRSGAAFAPLSLDTPRHRLHHIITELGAGVTLADDAGRELLDGLVVDIPPLESMRSHPGALPATGNEPTDPAVVIYTSGTTGRPKGVLVPHRGLLNTALWWAADTALTPADRVLCTWSTAFDGATFEAFRTLLSGAVLVYADDLERRDPRALTGLLRGPAGATVTSMTPSLARAMLESDEGGPTSLRVLYLGGEAVTRQLAEDCQSAWGAEVRNIYGPTEASCISTYAPIDLTEQRPPIGVPLPNTRAYVLGPHGEELPRGVPGALYVAGAGVAIGYFGQPELTRTAFPGDPYDPDPHARMYATGDRAVLREDGLIDCLGRMDDQVKILGHRVEPDEVRRLIEEQPGVRAAAVLAEGSPTRLVAFVELAVTGTLPTREDVLRPLQRWLPAAVLPAEIYVVPAIPMTVNDKADLATVSRMREVRLSAAARVDVELHGTELTAAGIFSRTLAHAGREVPSSIGPDTDFFVLGGHSLLAVTMLGGAERELGQALPLGRFLADPTVAGLGRLLAADRREPAARNGAGDRVHPASPVQRRFWLIDRIPQLRTAYLAPVVTELGGADPHLLAGCVGEVTARHPALRSRFTLDTKAREVRYTTQGPPPPVSVTDARDWPAARLTEHLSAACWTTFDLAVDAPARAEVVITDAGVTLVLAIHHIVIDGWGHSELLDQIAATYRARVAGTSPELPPVVHPASVRRVPGPVSADAALPRLRSAPTDVELPRDRPRGAVQTTRARALTAVLDPTLTADLRGTINELGVTTFMATAALFATVLARTGTQRDFLFVFPWVGRETTAESHAVGMFVNTLVLRVDLRGEPTWRELLRRVRESSMAAYRTADVPFDAVAAALHPNRDLSRPPVTPVYLAAMDAPPAAPSFGPGVTARLRDPEPLHLKYELELVATDLPDRLRLAITYATDLFDSSTVEKLLAGIEACAKDLTDDLDAVAMKENAQ